MTAYVGIDVSKKKLDVGFYSDKLGKNGQRKKKTKVFKNDRQAFSQLESWLTQQTQHKAQDIAIGIEATGIYHEALIYTLNEQGFKLFIANPGRAKKYFESLGVTHKTDKSDSLLLARFTEDKAHNGDITWWKPESPEARHLKLLIRRLKALQKDALREKNRLEACANTDTSPRVVKSIEDMIAVLNEEIKALLKEIDDHIDGHPQLKKNRELLESIDGVGPTVSRELTSLFSVKRFSSAKEAAAYLGLIPRLQESGSHKGMTRLSKIGPSAIRALLYLPAVVASRCNPDIAYQKQRLLAQGKTKMQALGAAMRKLVQICFGVIKHQEEYRPQTSLSV